MLKAMRLKNLRAFTDTGEIEFQKLNVFIGPNNAGKTTFTSGIELFLRSLRSSGYESPLAFSEMASFASFDAALRRHWSRNEKRPDKIELQYKYQPKGKDVVAINYICEADAGSQSTHVMRANYIRQGYKASVSAVQLNANVLRYRGSINKKNFKPGEVFFQKGLPVFSSRRSHEGGHGYSLKMFGDVSWIDVDDSLEIVKPFRPAPKSYYVLDDPHISPEERDFVTYLANLWIRVGDSSARIRDRIKEGLTSLGLTEFFEVVRTIQKRGPAVLEIRVAPHSVRQKVTIADAGFGLSQVLPLIVSDARLNKGSLIAYQPEVHLHPFAQSRLADLFVRSVVRGNQVFVESHSPDLVLRLQVLIAERQISAADVAVFCFENRKGKPAISKVTFDENAKPKVPWPSGFLDTSLSLARELAGSRIRGAEKK